MNHVLLRLRFVCYHHRRRHLYVGLGWFNSPTLPPSPSQPNTRRQWRCRRYAKYDAPHCKITSASTYLRHRPLRARAQFPTMLHTTSSDNVAHRALAACHRVHFQLLKYCTMSHGVQPFRTNYQHITKTGETQALADLTTFPCMHAWMRSYNLLKSALLALFACTAPCTSAPVTLHYSLSLCWDNKTLAHTWKTLRPRISLPLHSVVRNSINFWIGTQNMREPIPTFRTYAHIVVVCALDVVAHCVLCCGLRWAQVFIHSIFIHPSWPCVYHTWLSGPRLKVLACSGAGAYLVAVGFIHQHDKRIFCKSVITDVCVTEFCKVFFLYGNHMEEILGIAFAKYHEEIFAKGYH